MLLTSYQRMRRYLMSENAQGTIADMVLTDSDQNRARLLRWIGAVSQQVEKYLGRSLLIQSRTEYFDVRASQTEFWIQAPPIVTLTSVYEDSTGEWDGSESELTDPFIGIDSRSVVIDASLSLDYTARKAIRVIYTGGLAYDAVKSIYVVTGSADGWVAGRYVHGATSGAVGIVSSYDVSTTSLTLEVLYGTFEAGETLTEYTDEAGATATGESGTLSSKTRTALCEAYPDIVAATEAQVAHNFRFGSSFEVVGYNRDGSTIRRSSDDRRRLQPEAEALLMPYRTRHFP